MTASARADLNTDVLNDYIPDQRLNVCSYTQDQLKKIKNAVILAGASLISPQQKWFVLGAMILEYRAFPLGQ